MANKHIKRCSTPSTIREMQIKTTVRHHFTPTKMAIIKKIENKVFTEIWKNWNLHTVLVGM